MTAISLIENLKTRGFTLALADETIKVKPASRLTDADREAIRNHKNELLDLLGKKSLLPPSPEHCPSCNDQLILQDRKLDAWFCASCRQWFDGEGKPFSSFRRLAIMEATDDRT
jgi:hypothetical protein